MSETESCDKSESMAWEPYDPAIFTEPPTSNSVISLESSSSSVSIHNYLYPRKEVVEELHPEEVRWFHKRNTDKKWTAFIGYDSLRIECKYRELLLSSHLTQNNVEMVLVRGGLYEVDVATNTCFPVYWSEEVSSVMRGSWFYDVSWQPLEETYCNALESEHMQHFAGKKLDEQIESPKKGPKPVLHNVKFQDFYVDWNGPDNIYIFSEATSSRLIRQFSQSLGFSKAGTRLRRGYCKEAVMDDKPADITHLVFVVHGIGQKIGTGNIVKCCLGLRDTVNTVKQKQFPHLMDCNERAEFLPVEWRTNLKLDGDTVDQITPQRMKSFRTLVNSSAMDILYYTSPLYRSEIIHGLRTELNRLYLMFCERNPYFVPRDGKVSIIAHSLGSVITYDILTDWNPIQVYDQFLSSLIEEEIENAAGSVELQNQLYTARSRVKDLESLLIAVHNKQVQNSSPLNFQIENLFCLGSPLAVFLALRGHQPPESCINKSLIPDTMCSRLFNIFHPADPVAYRLEPLLLKRYTHIHPVIISDVRTQTPVAVSSSSAVSLTDTPISSNNVQSPTQRSATAITQPRFSIASMLTRLSRGRSIDLPDILAKESNSPKCQNAETTASNTNSNCNNVTTTNDLMGNADCCIVKPDDIDIDYRIDYQLRESNFESSYISTLTSHTSYWTNHDVAAFIITNLYNNMDTKVLKSSL